MGRMVWVPVVSGPLAQFAAEYLSWLASRQYSRWAAADRLYQFDQLSRWLASEGGGAGDLTSGQAERFAGMRRAAGVVSWSSPRSVALPLEFLRASGSECRWHCMALETNRPAHLQNGRASVVRDELIHLLRCLRR